MPACGGNFGLRILNGAGSAAKRNSQVLETLLELKAGELEQLGRLPEIDLPGEVIAQDPGSQKTSDDIFR